MNRRTSFDVISQTPVIKRTPGFTFRAEARYPPDHSPGFPAGAIIFAHTGQGIFSGNDLCAVHFFIEGGEYSGR